MGLEDLFEDELGKSIQALLTWIKKDYGDGMEACVVRDLMMLARDEPGISLENIVAEIALDWSK